MNVKFCKIKAALMFGCLLVMAMRFVSGANDDLEIFNILNSKKHSFNKIEYKENGGDKNMSGAEDVYKAKVEGIVVDDPELKNGTIKFTAKVKSINGITLSNKKHTVLFKTDVQNILYGDEFEASSIIKKPEVIVSEDGRTFNYKNFLSKDNIFYIADARGKNKETLEPNLVVIKHGGGNKIISFLYQFKKQFIEQLNNVLPSPHSFLASGLIISGKGSLDKKLQQDFQRVGLIHIVVLSGFNISIIGEAIVRLFSFLPQTVGALCGATGIILFSIMTGGGATVIRSAIMSIIGLYARISNRTNSALTSLLVAGFLMLMWNPKLAFYDPSFQLSFTATLGLILYAEPIEKFLTPVGKKLKIFPSIISLVSSTLATQIFTLPLIAQFSGVLSIVALPVNILVLPFIPITMFFTFVTGLVSFISLKLSLLPAFVSYVLLSYELFVVSFSSELSFAAVYLPPISPMVVFFAYTLLLFVGTRLYKQKDRQQSLRNIKAPG